MTVTQIKKIIKKNNLCRNFSQFLVVFVIKIRNKYLNAGHVQNKYIVWSTKFGLKEREKNKCLRTDSLKIGSFRPGPNMAIQVPKSQIVRLRSRSRSSCLVFNYYYLSMKIKLFDLDLFPHTFHMDSPIDKIMGIFFLNHMFDRKSFFSAGWSWSLVEIASQRFFFF